MAFLDEQGLAYFWEKVKERTVREPITNLDVSWALFGAAKYDPNGGTDQYGLIQNFTASIAMRKNQIMQDVELILVYFDHDIPPSSGLSINDGYWGFLNPHGRGSHSTLTETIKAPCVLMLAGSHYHSSAEDIYFWDILNYTQIEPPTWEEITGKPYVEPIGICTDAVNVTEKKVKIPNSDFSTLSSKSMYKEIGVVFQNGLGRATSLIVIDANGAEKQGKIYVPTGDYEYKPFSVSTLGKDFVKRIVHFEFDVILVEGESISIWVITDPLPIDQKDLEAILVE